MLNKSQLVTVGLIQAKAHKEPSENLSSTLTKAEQAAKDGAQIICTQELFLTEYFCQCEDLLTDETLGHEFGRCHICKFFREL